MNQVLRWWLKGAFSDATLTVAEIYQLSSKISLPTHEMPTCPSIVWTYPVQGIIKLNMYGSFYPKQTKSGIGGVFLGR